MNINFNIEYQRLNDFKRFNKKNISNLIKLGGETAELIQLNTQLIQNLNKIKKPLNEPFFLFNPKIQSSNKKNNFIITNIEQADINTPTSSIELLPIKKKSDNIKINKSSISNLKYLTPKKIPTKKLTSSILPIIKLDQINTPTSTETSKRNTFISRESLGLDQINTPTSTETSKRNTFISKESLGLDQINTPTSTETSKRNTFISRESLGLDQINTPTSTETSKRNTFISRESLGLDQINTPTSTETSKRNTFISRESLGLDQINTPTSTETSKRNTFISRDEKLNLYKLQNEILLNRIKKLEKLNELKDEALEIMVEKNSNNINKLFSTL